MDRRRLLSLGILSGLTAGVSLTTRRLFAQQAAPGIEPYTGKFFIFLNAGGGWDPTMVCDPKGGETNRGFTAAQIREAGNIRYAPVNYTGEGGYSNQRFFEKFSPRLMVLNGVDMQTNNHDSGNRYTWSGHLEDGYPPLAAIIGAALAPGRPLAFLSNGGYENTQGIVPLTRVNDLGTISRIAFPNRPDPANMTSRYHSTDTAARIARYQQERLHAMGATQTLPVFDRAMRQLEATRSGGNLLERLLQFLPDNATINGLNNTVARQGFVALAAYQAGLTAAANLDVGGFDTHSDHDTQQGNALVRVLRGIDLIMDRVDALNLREKVVLIVGSDFGRTPFYNMQNGKDHWANTSIMMMGAGIPGNRVVGASTDGTAAQVFRARPFDYDTLQVSDSSPKKLNPKSLHTALRRFAGVEQSEAARQFPLYGDNLTLFS
ncbi:MAG: DUF1501 domain-containing protein [Deltaproteobacteria bacterium]|nr:DUF1501 domain-containing protein [Deltaproteobacteria bacterium]